MEQVPEPSIAPLLDETLKWIAHERDACWTAKLVILRVQELEDIRHFGACLREHDAHVQELAQFARTGVFLDPAVISEPSFITREPHIVGALSDSRAVLEAMESIEATRIARYLSRQGSAPESQRRRLDAILDRHLVDAQNRLRWLRGDRSQSEYIREHAA